MKRIFNETLKQAINGDAEAQYEVGCWFALIDLNSAARFWLGKSARKGNMHASSLLRMIYKYKEVNGCQE